MTERTVMERIAACIELGQQGERDGARAGLEAIWREREGLDPVTRCGLAHSLADVQDEARDELGWDLLALTEALSASDEDVAAAGMALGVAGLMPSLHLNLADVYRRLGLFDAARGHANEAKRALGLVASNPYFETIAGAIQRVLARVDTSDPG